MVDSLSEQMQPLFSDSLHSKLFSPDFKKHIEALTEMTGFLDSYKAEFVDSLDMVLKWVTLRFFDSNMAVLKKNVEFAQALFTSLESQDYHLSDYEANLFIPFLVEKVGNNNDTIRQTMKSLFKLLCKLYPASKLAKFLLEGLKSKNARTRADSLDELAYLVERQGIIVIGLKALPVIAEHVTERESTVRNAALNCLVKCHLHIGNDLYKNLPNLPDAAKEALQEKLKYAPAVTPAAPSAIPKKPLKVETKASSAVSSDTEEVTPR
jgi:cytoskeleton-associated protein 5